MSREFLGSKSPLVVKVGRTSQPFCKRLSQYPNGSELIFAIHVRDAQACVDAEATPSGYSGHVLHPACCCPLWNELPHSTRCYTTEKIDPLHEPVSVEHPSQIFVSAAFDAALL